MFENISHHKIKSGTERNFGLVFAAVFLIISLYPLWFGKNMHFCAEDLSKIVLKKGCKMSLATIYNNLHHLVDAGLLKKRQISNNRTYFDNNVTDHFHIFDEENNMLIDIPYSDVKFSKLPKLPKNKKIKNINLIINLENK